MKKKTGFHNLYEYAANNSKNKECIKILGLGSGACGNELNGIIPLLRDSKEVQLTAIDINDHLLEIAKRKAEEKKIPFTPIIEDINTISLIKNNYDIIVAYGSLHHFFKLGHIAFEINKALKQDGILVTVDIPTRTGYKMWDETFEIVESIWKALPDKFKIDHTGSLKPFLAKEIFNVDYSVNSFECVNSEAILPSLRSNLREVAYVPAFAFMRRFFDTKFGPNYDISNALDTSTFEFIKNLDLYYIDNNILKPETFFGAYEKKI